MPDKELCVRFCMSPVQWKCNEYLCDTEDMS